MSDSKDWFLVHNVNHVIFSVKVAYISEYYDLFWKLFIEYMGNFLYLFIKRRFIVELLTVGLFGLIILLMLFMPFVLISFK